MFPLKYLMCVAYVNTEPVCQSGVCGEDGKVTEWAALMCVSEILLPPLCLPLI